MSKMTPIKNMNDISIVLCGQAGMGIQTVEYLLTRILKLAGYNVFSTKEYMSRVRGGTNSTEIRISSDPVRACIDRIDILVPLNKGAVEHVRKRISPDTVILAEKETLGDDSYQRRCNCIDVPFNKIATEIGNKIYANIVAVGTITGLFGIDRQTVDSYIKQFFAAKADKVIQENIQAASTGHKIGIDLANSGKISVDISKDSSF
jgi:2-oxoglutarate ferredoxin oxidoreductase subunit alpha